MGRTERALCGISGHVARSGFPSRIDLVERMTAALSHRGPDAAAVFADPSLALGCTRLAIIDVSGSSQPLRSADGGSCAGGELVLVANAEIYNFAELREGLRRRGHVFTTDGDCEVILHLYEEHGERAVDHLRGMFAFALWDRRRGRLTLARDRMGEKPLYYTERPDGLLFASEAKALTAAGVPVELDPDGVADFFHLEYVPEPRSILRDVRKVPAGHVVTVDIRPWRVRSRPYWRLEDVEPIDGSCAELVGEILTGLGPLVTRTDRPLGISLSGGLDSSVVAALAAKFCAAPVRAFSVGYAGRPANDERHHARQLATSLGMPFHEIEIDTARATADLPVVVAAQDDPVADFAGICYHAVMRAAAEAGVRVMLQGQGADELFWGYPWVRRAVALSEARGKLVFYQLDPDFREADRDGPGYFGEAMRDAARTEFEPSGARPDIDLTGLIAGTYLRENGIAQCDRLGMANSVELRAPFVDHRLVEAVVGTRKTRPDHRDPPKQRLREAAYALLPARIADRPKQSFSPPLRAWHAAFLRAYGDLLPGGELVRRGILTEFAARRLSVADFPDGAGSPFSFKALMLEMWCRRNVARARR
ncbi:asparagine synthase (glutamine-hydrolyzing) [Nocardia sp. bgisy134]|uniref:asparagine synthase (glutamine-hydrolyzing) n=1 Tax=Nocardia sp. bgisy134 TaxID=3413789 RepID=UPI003D7374ED